MQVRAGSWARRAVAALALVVAGCGGGGSNNSSKLRHQPAAAARAAPSTVLMGTAPDYLDPQLGYTTQSAEPDWITYTPLLTYRHANGKAGGELIPGLATALPKVSRRRPDLHADAAQRARRSPTADR